MFQYYRFSLVKNKFFFWCKQTVLCFHVRWLLPDMSLSEFPVQDINVQPVIYPRTISHQNVVSMCAIEHRQVDQDSKEPRNRMAVRPSLASSSVGVALGVLVFVPLVLPSRASLSAWPGRLSLSVPWGSCSARQGSVGIFPLTIKTHLWFSSLQLPGKTLLLSGHFEAKTQT